MTSTLEKLGRLPADGNLVALAMRYITSPAFESSFATGAGFLFVFGHYINLSRPGEFLACSHIITRVEPILLIPLLPVPFRSAQLLFLSSRGF